MINRTRALVVMSLLPSLIAAAPAKPAARAAATKPASTTTTTTASTASTTRAVTLAQRRAKADAAAAAVRAAVVALTKEYEDFLRNGGTAAREASNYFRDYPNEAVTPEAVVTVLQARGGGDPRTSAYVKWQLHSAQPDGEAAADDGSGNGSAGGSGNETAPALAKQLLAAYRAAPQPIPRPGMSPQDQKQLDAYVRGKKQSEEADLKADFGAGVARVARQNAVILRYRDDLYKKLPKNPETFAAGMDDLVQRLQVAAEDKAMLKQLVADVRQWAAVEPRPPHVLSALARAARKLADTKGPQYYDAPYWRSSNVFGWRKARGSVDSASALKDLAVYLEEQAATPPLEIKDAKD